MIHVIQLKWLFMGVVSPDQTKSIQIKCTGATSSVHPHKSSSLFVWRVGAS